jgi:hypothetical protein
MGTFPTCVLFSPTELADTTRNMFILLFNHHYRYLHCSEELKEFSVLKEKVAISFAFLHKLSVLNDFSE